MIVLSLHYLLGLLVTHWNSFSLKHLVIRVGSDEIAIYELGRRVQDRHKIVS
jgi:hypothetical protein